MKKYFLYFIILIFLITILQNNHTINLNPRNKKTYIDMQKNISSKIIRLHVIGNSNSTYDQQLKIHIKNTIVTMLEPKLHDVNNLSQARQIIMNNLSTINSIAKKELIKHNSSYSVNTTLSTDFFPIKQYGDMTLPEGKYESVCVKLGNASGKNWWCVLYPTLCFVDCTHSILPSDSKEKLKNTLNSSEYNYIMNNPNTKITYQSSIANLFKKLFTK